MMTAITDTPFTTRRFLIWIVSFFGIIFLADGIMVWKAVSTFDGIEVKNAYEQGRAYNKVLDAARAQTLRGWAATAVHAPLADKPGYRLTLSLTDKAGAPIDDLVVTARFRRTVTDTEDMTVRLASKGDGAYVADASLAGYGRWDLKWTAARKGEVLWERDEMLNLARD